MPRPGTAATPRGAACQVIAGATGASYTPTAADVGHTLVGVITATNVDGSVPSASPASQVVLPAAPRWRDLPVLAATGGDVGDGLTITAGVWTGPPVTSDTTQVMRCTNSCVPVSAAAQYTIASADVGAILRVRETAVNAGGTTVMWSAQYVGPVASAGSASAVLLAGQAVLRNAAGAALAVAQVTGSAAMTADAFTAAGARRPGTCSRRVVRVRRRPARPRPPAGLGVPRRHSPGDPARRGATVVHPAVLHRRLGAGQASGDDDREGAHRRRPPRALN